MSQTLDYSSSTGRAKLVGVEGLRGVAALAVMSGHVVVLLAGPIAFAGLLGPLTNAALQGITLFFALSGYLLYRPWVEAILHGRASPRLGTFLRNRVLRIYPAHTVVLLVAALVGVAIATNDGPAPISVSESQVGHLTDPLTLVANLFLLQGLLPSTVLTGLGVSWSLITELGFYLLLPPLGALGLWLARRLPPVVAALLPALVLVAVALVNRLAFGSMAAGSTLSAEELRSGATWETVWFRSVFLQGDLLAVGMIACVAVVACRRADADRVRPLRRLGWAAVAVGGLAMLVTLGSDWFGPAIGVVCLGLLLLLQLPHPGGLVRLGLAVLESAPLKAAGLYSYSIYLWHFPVIWFLRLHVDDARFTNVSGLLATWLMVTVPTVALAAVTYRFVELPAMRRKRPVTAQPSPAGRAG